MSGVNMNVLQNPADKISLCILERTRMYSCWPLIWPLKEVYLELSRCD